MTTDHDQAVTPEQVLAEALTPFHGPGFFPGIRDVTIIAEKPIDAARQILAALAERGYRVSKGDLDAVRAIVDEQAEDEGLWFIAPTAPEAYLQQELRRLHAVIEAAHLSQAGRKESKK